MTDATAMRYGQLGASGLTVSVVGLGCNSLGRQVDRAGTAALVVAALDAGITLFDTADVYGTPQGTSEEFLGAALGQSRADAVIATKFGMDMHGANGPDQGIRGSRRYILRAVEASLRRLGTDYIDLLQYHEPDGVTPIDETLAALDQLVAAGKVRYLGSSNFAAWQVADAEHVARTAGGERFVSAQNRYSLLTRDVERELVPACEAFGVGILPFFPLESGLLSGKYHRREHPPEGTRLATRPEAHDKADWDTIEALTAYAQERGRSLLDVAIGGLAARPGVASVIAGATSPVQVRANATAGSWQPSVDDLAALSALLP